MTSKAKKKPKKTPEKEPESPSEKEVEKSIAQMLPTKSISGFVPKTLPEIMDLSKLLAGSDLVPKGLKGRTADVMICIMHGLEIGVSPAQALSNIMVVNGRPSVWGDLAIGIVRGSGLMKSFKEDPPHVALKQGFGRCQVERINGEKLDYQFSIDDAKKANLWGKVGPWTNYPGRMLMMRPRSWAPRDLFPDVFKGIAIAEEVRDISVIEAEIVPEVPDPTPAPSSEPPAAEPTGEDGNSVSTFKVTKIVKTERDGKPIFRIYDGDGIKYETDSDGVATLAKKAKKEEAVVRCEWLQADGYREILLLSQDVA